MPLNARYYVPCYAYIIISISQGEPTELVESETNVYVLHFARFFEFWSRANLRLRDFANGRFDLVIRKYIFYRIVRTYVP